MYAGRSCNKASSIAIDPLSASLIVEALEFYVLVSERLGCDCEEAENFVLVEHKGYVTKVVEPSDEQVDVLLGLPKQVTSVHASLGMMQSASMGKEIIDAFEGRKRDVVLREP
jgi:hypothetical protein